ncbi:MAG: molecular chaperone HtpG, partial [Aquabacterium sp.]
LSYLYEFEGHALTSVAKGAVDLGDLQDEEEKKQAEAAAETFKPLLERAKGLLEGKAREVRVSSRLVDSAACLVVEEGDMSGHLARLLKSAGQLDRAAASLPILEINTAHPLVRRLQSEGDDARASDLAHVLFDQALLAEGGQLEDPAAYVRRVNGLLVGAA